ncbi:hypothetical protein D3C78_1866830 [compost metagenome]
MLADPYADPRAGAWIAGLLALGLVLALAWRMHWMDGLLPVAWQHAPSAVSAAPAP